MRVLAYNDHVSQTNHTMEPNYAYLSGAYEGLLKSLTFTLVQRGLIKYEDRQVVETMLEQENDRIKAKELEFSKRLKF